MFALATGKPLQWRLLSGNNRESGRGVLSFSDVESCREAILELQSTLDTTHLQVRRTGNNQWTWQLLIGDVAVAAATREYDRMIRCEQAAQAFLRSLRTAIISDTITISNARRWESRAMTDPVTRLVREC